MAKKTPPLPGMNTDGGNPFASGGMKPKNAPPGRSGAKKGMPNFKSRITKPGGMNAGGVVKNPTGGAGQGSGIGRLKMSK